MSYQNDPTISSMLKQYRPVLFSGGGIILFLIILFQALFVVPKGHVGVITTFGAVSKTERLPGLNAKIPFVQGVEMMESRIRSFPTQGASASSKDLQTVTTNVEVQYSIDGRYGGEILDGVGTIEDFEKKILAAAVQEALKSTTARSTAEGLITNRTQVQTDFTAALNAYVQNTLRGKGLADAVKIQNVAVTNFAFSTDFEKSIEKKEIAKQQKLEEEEVAAKKRIQADAEAYKITTESTARAAAIKREADALSANPNIVQLRAVEEWNGQLPQFMGGDGTVPFVNLPLNGGNSTK